MKWRRKLKNADSSRKSRAIQKREFDALKLEYSRSIETYDLHLRNIRKTHENEISALKQEMKFQDSYIFMNVLSWMNAIQWVIAF